MKIRSIALTIALPLMTLAAGIGIGIGYAQPAETEVVPAPSFAGQGREMLQYVCVHNAAFSSLAKTEYREQKTLERLNVQAVPLSDRGVICHVDGVLFTKRYSTTGATATSEPLQATILVSGTGESEVVTSEFANALRQSATVKAMASNVGNDGTIVPKIKLNF